MIISNVHENRKANAVMTVRQSNRLNHLYNSLYEPV